MDHHNNNHLQSPPPTPSGGVGGAPTTTTPIQSSGSRNMTTPSMTGRVKKLSRYETMMDQKVLITSSTLSNARTGGSGSNNSNSGSTISDDVETADGRIRNQEASQRIRDTWIYKQVRLRQDEFIRYQQVSFWLSVKLRCLVCLFALVVVAIQPKYIIIESFVF
jgi:hypothetical protein